MNWYIGQPIVALENHFQGAFKKGDEFVIKGLREAICKCKEIDIDIGLIEKNANAESCRVCGFFTMTTNTTWWFSEKRFAPLDTDISELTEILTQKQVI
jgi:hypothetical protein